MVLADKKIAEKLPRETWQGVCDLMIAGIKKKDLAGGLINALNKSGELLQPLFPIKPDDINELPNELIIKE